MDDLIRRQRLLKELKHHKELFCRNRIEFLGLSKNDKARVDEIDNCIATVINAPSVQPDMYEALRILDAIHSSGRLDYGDYCDLHDAISEIGWAQNG